MKRFMVLIGVLLLITSAVALAQDESKIEVQAIVETDPSPGDGAAEPLVWLHPTDLSQSLILGTDDNMGIGVYNLDGELLFFDEQYGGLGGADIRYNFGNRNIPLIAAAVADEPRVVFMTIEPDSGTLINVGELETGVNLATVCLYQSPLTQIFYAIAINEFGKLEQYALSEDDGEISAKLARAIDVGGEIESCVTDDALRRLYIAEGEALVWRYGAEPEDGIIRGFVDVVGGHIAEEIEGLAIYPMANNKGYLIVSNETADSLLVYERTGDNRFVGEFSIEASETIDKVTEPTGMYAIGVALDERFPQGVFIAADDVNSNPNGNNNFKVVSWADVATGLNLTIEEPLDPRVLENAPTSDAVTVTAELETLPVPAATDAADDPAIWIHPEDRALSLIIGTDKVNGLVVYDLVGNVLQTINIGRVNNVDVRDGFELNGKIVSLVTATNRSESSLVIYAVDVENLQLVDVATRTIVSNVEEVYGTCMYVSPVNGKHYVFVNSADTGEVEQYELSAVGDKVDATVVRTFVVGSQTEGCVVDDENQALYIGEEAIGFYKYSAEPDADDSRVMIDNTTEEGHLTADVEGIALYAGPDGRGYLIVSSQGSSEFVVYDREGDNAYIGTFRIVENDTVDAVSGTDGLDVTAYALGDAFPDGLLVVQDDLNINPASTQNFKLVSWRIIAEALGLEVMVR